MGMFLRRGSLDNIRLSTLKTGQTIKLNMSGSPVDFLIIQRGLPSELYDASCDGIWLLTKDIYEKRPLASTTGNDYENSDTHAYLNSTFLDLFDSRVKNAIKQVKIPYRMGGGSGGTNQSGANGLSCKAFLLSVRELGYAKTGSNQYAPNDGSVLEYFAANDDRIAYFEGTADIYYTRSPRTNSNSNMWGVTATGSFDTISNSTYTKGIRPAIILPADFILTNDMLATGG